MAERHVGPGKEYATPAKAAAVAKAGDMFVVHEGVYPPFKADVDGVAWMAATGERPIIDGGWKQNDLGKDADNASGIGISAADILISGFEVRNVPGRGVVMGPGARNVVLEEFYIHHTFHGGVVVNGMGKTVRNVTIQRGVVEYISLSTRWKETPVNGCFPIKDTDGILIEDVVIQFGGGEGIAAGTRTKGFTARRVTVANAKHLAAYANRAQDVLFEDCIFRQDGLPEWMQHDGDPGAGPVVGDEVTPGVTEHWQHCERVTFRRCVSVGTGSLFGIRNNDTNQATGGYDTTIRELTVENCTFIARPWTKLGVAIQDNPRGGNIGGVFRNNVFVTDRMKPGATLFRSNAPGVRFVDNAWTTVPSGPGMGAGNIQIEAVEELVAPFATPFDVNNLRPRSGGVVAERGWGAVAAEVSPPPPPPEPEPEPDWAALRGLAAEATAEATTAHMAADRATRLMQTLDNRMREYELADQSGKE